uniref:Uncharacterized protein n=1 Tax=Caenorhabditis japonica TaxID=281687 RepID=A0A8R1HUW6_CAEJA
MTRFRNHANQEECEAAVCRNSEMRKDVNYGELPVGATTIDQDRFNFNFSRKRTALTDEQLQSGAEFDDKGRNSDETSSSAGSDATPNLTADASDIFGSNSMIMTEFGLKRLSDYKRTTEFRKRVLAEADNEYVEKKERHAPSRSQQYHHHQQQQQQNNASSRMEYIPPTIAYPYAPFVGKYPDLQPTPQHFLPTVYSQETQLSPPPPSLDQLHYDDEVEGFGRPMSADKYYVSDNFPKDNGMGSDLLGNDGNKDPIYEELSKLQFVMPLADENECDEDLVDILNF